MSKKERTAISPTRAENYPEWYQQVTATAGLAEVSPVRGCMVIKPWGYAIWENIQSVLDQAFKNKGVENAYFPLFIPKSFLEKEAEHVEGFAKECAVVTHHRLEEGPDGGLVPAGKLEEPLVVRPTSETIIGTMFAQWVQSYRDLPLLINQWANVVRWEMRTRLFLRTTEFLWQEGHTVHATGEEALEMTLSMLDVYAAFAEKFMAMPVIKGEKTKDERFPGALSTFTIEAMMQDKKALQAGTSHFLGQNFSKAQNIQYQSKEGSLEYAWTTSWGVSTRLIGALIMTHSDDNGLVLPPRLAPKHLAIIPIWRKEEEREAVLAHCRELAEELKNERYDGAPLRVMLDERDLTGSERSWDLIKKGVPLRVEVGPRDIAEESVFVGRRDHAPRDKKSYPRKEFPGLVAGILEDIQKNLYAKAKAFQEENIQELDSEKAFLSFFQNEQAGFAKVFAADSEAYGELLKELKVTARCIPLDNNDKLGTCIFTGEEGVKQIIFGKAY